MRIFVRMQRKYDFEHSKAGTEYKKKLQKAYLKALNLVTKLAPGLNLNDEGDLYFRNNSRINKQINTILEGLYEDVYGTTVEGINTEWDRAVEKNNEIATNIYGKGLADLPAQYKDKYLSNNAAARRNFVYRKDNGLGLSDKIWNNTKQFKQELELALEHGIGKGKSAARIAKDVKKYLNDPDKLFRRVKSKKNGELRLSKAAKAYHPGAGRYRSSYKNALRLTANETNFSYEGSQELKRSQQDFIVGIEIKTSPRHKISDDKGGISCNRLKGKYPKGFKWTFKWHVNCRCYSLNIVKTRAELLQDTNKILDGKAPDTPSSREVKGVPVDYKDESEKWLKKSKRWKSTPRTFENNKGFKTAEPEGG